MRDCGKDVHGLEQLLGVLQDSLRSPVRSPVRRNQETWNVGAGSGCSRDRQARWDAQEMRTATTKVRREAYETFRQLCEERGSTPYAELRDFLLAFVEYFSNGGKFDDEDLGGGGEGPEEVQDKPFTGWHTTG